MRPRLWPLLLLVVGAPLLLFLLSASAAADIIDPSAPYTPHQPEVRSASPVTPAPVVPATPMSSSAGRQAETPPAPSAEPVPSAQPDAQPAPEPSVAPVAAVAETGPAQVPEIRQRSTTRAVSGATARRVGAETPRSETNQDAGPLEPVVDTVQHAVDQVGVFLAEVASACKVGVGAGSGGPVLVFAVLGMAAALERRRVLRARWATDEEVPELLYAGDVIAPG